VLEKEHPDDSLLVALWHARHLQGGASCDRELQAALRKGRRDWELSEVKAHYTKHFANQPNPSARYSEDLADSVLDESLKERDLAILRFVHQLWLVRPEHVRAWFFPESSYGSWHASSVMNAKILRRLRHQFLLYRRVIEGIDTKTGDGTVAYGLGRVGAGVIDLWREENFDGRQRSAGYIGSPSDIADVHLPHDLGCLDILSRIHQAGKGGVVLNGRTFSVSLPPQNLYAARHLGFTVPVPRVLDEFGELRAVPEHTLFSDAFAVAEAHDASSGATVHIPFLYEHDTGSKQAWLVAEQLWSYLILAKAGAVEARFPELAVEGYQVPLLMATGTRRVLGFRGDRRLLTLMERFRVLAQNRRLLNLGEQMPQPPIFLCLRKEIEERGLEAPVYSVWEPGRAIPLAQALMSTAKPLYAGHRFQPGHDFDIDLAAFKPEKSKGGTSLQVLGTQAREQKLAKKRDERAKLANSHAAYQAEEAERERIISASVAQHHEEEAQRQQELEQTRARILAAGGGR
jgi:hypothetical protein